MTASDFIYYHDVPVVYFELTDNQFAIFPVDVHAPMTGERVIKKNCFSQAKPTANNHK